MGVGLAEGDCGAGAGAVEVGCGVTYVVEYTTFVTVAVLLDAGGGFTGAGDDWAAEDAWAADDAAA